MVNLFHSFSKIKPQKVLVVGDLILDTYTVGKVRRISPEAPVVILQVQYEENRPGGAGNVALNLVSMGMDVAVLGRVGNDEYGKNLLEALAVEKISTVGVVTQQAYPTPVKNRVIADNQQIVRVDREQVTQLTEQLEKQVIEKVSTILEGVSLIAISDYGKGFITKTLMSAMIGRAKELGIQVIVDPKGADFSIYRGANVVKPNVSEFYAAANLPMDASLEQAATRIFETTQSEVILTTRSEEGISLFYSDGKREDFPVRIREVKDVTGAGDTVLAMLSCAAANGLSIAEGAQLSNIAAGIAIERFGCARITLAELARRLLYEDVSNKLFDEEHLPTLQEALKGRRYATLEVSGQQGLTTPIFSAIRKLGQRDNWDLLVYVNDLQPCNEFIDVLSSLHEVDYLINNSSTLQRLCANNSREEVYIIVDGKLKKGVSCLGEKSIVG
ncbi:MAG: Bifunctional protein HldE [Chlamydiae bacterium]|nr:Bifunctional protein HldE [Chlamydiota bacterium]